VFVAHTGTDDLGGICLSMIYHLPPDPVWLGAMGLTGCAQHKKLSTRLHCKKVQSMADSHPERTVEQEHSPTILPAISPAFYPLCSSQSGESAVKDLILIT
jgi:hypothetical protein